jgi:hypothetical protein
LLSPDLKRTVASLAALGEGPRRERDAQLAGRPMRQIFFRFGEVIVEVVGSPEKTDAGPSTLWGISGGAGSPPFGITISGCRCGPR